MSSKPKKAATKAASVDGARLRRLARAGFEGADRCALLGVDLDVGPRANPWFTPRKLIGDVVSELGAAIIASGVTPEALKLAATVLRRRGGS